jgi:hypothetical protein
MRTRKLFFTTLIFMSSIIQKGKFGEFYRKKKYLDNMRKKKSPLKKIYIAVLVLAALAILVVRVVLPLL